ILFSIQMGGWMRGWMQGAGGWDGRGMDGWMDGLVGRSTRFGGWWLAPGRFGGLGLHLYPISYPYPYPGPSTYYCSFFVGCVVGFLKFSGRLIVRLDCVGSIGLLENHRVLL